MSASQPPSRPAEADPNDFEVGGTEPRAIAGTDSAAQILELADGLSIEQRERRFDELVGRAKSAAAAPTWTPELERRTREALLGENLVGDLDDVLARVRERLRGLSGGLSRVPVHPGDDDVEYLDDPDLEASLHEEATATADEVMAELHALIAAHGERQAADAGRAAVQALLSSRVELPEGAESSLDLLRQDRDR